MPIINLVYQAPEITPITVQTFDFKNNWMLNFTGYSIGYWTPDYISNEGWRIWTSDSSTYQWWITIPNSVFVGDLKSIKIYRYKPQTTTSYAWTAIWICDHNQANMIEYWRLWWGILVNWNKTNAIDPVWEITTEFIMEDNWDVTVKINDTSYNVGSYASTYTTLWTNKALCIEMWRWYKPTHYIRKLEITTL